MSKVVNEPKHKNALLQAVRAQLEHRAHWLYLLCDEAGKRGLEWEDFGSAAVKRCGLSQGADLVEKGKTDSLKGLKKTLFTKPAQWVFEMDIKESTDDTLFIDFHYCPLVKAWQKAGCTDEEIAERDKLRRIYIDNVKASLIGQLDNTYIVEPDGTKRPVKPKQ